MSLLELWTVYEHPADAPDLFVARRFVVTKEGAFPTGETLEHEDIGEIQRALEEKGKVKLMRSTGDAPHIRETWI